MVKFQKPATYSILYENFVLPGLMNSKAFCYKEPKQSFAKLKIQHKQHCN